MIYGPISFDVSNNNGKPVFAGTDTPVQAFFEYLEAGKSPEIFLSDYPAVNKKDVTELLQIAKHLLTSEQVLKENLPLR